MLDIHPEKSRHNIKSYVTLKNIITLIIAAAIIWSAVLLQTSSDAQFN